MNSIKVQIEKDSITPIYHQIEEAIRVQITSGQLQPYDLIPSENELSRTHDISPMTVRQAMNKLVQEGFVYRKRGKGTFVAPRHIEHPLTRLVSFSEDIQSRGLEPGMQILEFGTVEATEEVAARLLIEFGKPVLHVKRLRLVNGYAVGIHDTYLRESWFSRAELEGCGSLYLLFEQKGIKIREGQEEIEAISATKEMSRLLHVPVRSPLLMVQRTTYSFDNLPIELVYAVYRSDFYRYKIQLGR